MKKITKIIAQSHFDAESVFISPKAYTDTPGGHNNIKKNKIHNSYKKGNSEEELDCSASELP